MRVSGQGKAAFPPPPWKQRGDAWLYLQNVAVERLSVPPPFQPVTLPGGRCPGGLCLARYTEGSTLSYHELFYFCLVRQRARVGLWLPWLYVDSSASREGGRTLWGLPKRLAQFSWRSGADCDEVEVGDDAGELCRLRVSHGGRVGLVLPMLGPLFSQRLGQSLLLWPRGRARLSRATLTLQLPDASPLADLGLQGGNAWQLRDFRLLMPEAV